MAWVIGGLAYFGLVGIMCLFFHGCSLRRYEEVAKGAMGNKTYNANCQNCGKQFEIEVKTKTTIAEIEAFVCNGCNHDGSFGEAIHEAERCLE